MSELKDISETITLEATKEYVQVTLQANQYQLERLEQFQQFLKSSRGFYREKNTSNGRSVSDSIP